MYFLQYGLIASALAFLTTIYHKNNQKMAEVVKDTHPPPKIVDKRTITNMGRKKVVAVSPVDQPAVYSTVSQRTLMAMPNYLIELEDGNAFYNSVPFTVGTILN
jgi:hypothetical protein